MTDTAENWVEKAHDHMQAGDFGLALNAANTALNLRTFDDAWATRGSASFALGNLEDAERCYVQAVELSPNEAVYREGLGRVYLEQERDELALASFGHAVELDPTSVDAHAGVVIALGSLDRTSEARERSASLYALHPDDAEVRLLHGLSIVASVDDYLTEISDGGVVVTSGAQYDRLKSDVELLRELDVEDRDLVEEVQVMADMVRSERKRGWAPDRPYLYEFKGKIMALAAVVIVIIAGAAHVVLSAVTMIALVYLFLRRYLVQRWKGREIYWRSGLDAELYDPPRRVVRWGIGH